MNKKFILSGVVLALVVLLVNSAFALTATNPTFSASNPGTSVSGTFVLTDTDAGVDTDPIIGLMFNSASVSLNGDTAGNIIPASAISFSSSTGTILTDGATATVTTTVAIPENQAADTYTGTLKIVGIEGGSSINTTFDLSLTVVQLTALNVESYDASTALEIIGEEGDTGLTGTFTIKNTGNQALSNLEFDTSALDLKDEDDDVITLSFSDAGTLNGGDSKVVTVTAGFEDNIELDTYGGIVSVKQGSNVLDSFKLDLKVFPEVCEDGIVSDGDASSRTTADLEIVDVKEPDKGDDFKVGDDIKVEVKVKNNGEDDLDVIVEAILYNLDQDEEVVTMESEEEEVKDGKSETIEFDMEIPSSSDMDVDDRYLLFVKVYEDGDEDQNCNFESVELEFKRDKNDVVADSVELNPSTVKPGEDASLVIDLLNEGTKDQEDVYVKIINEELGIEITSNVFDLDKAGDSDDDITKRFTLSIPDNAAEKDYILDIAVYDEDDDVYDNGQEFKTLKVKNGGTIATTVDVSVKSSMTEVDGSSRKANLHFVVTNAESEDVAATLELTTVGGWAEPISGQTVNLHPGDNNLYFNVNLADVSEGMHSASVLVKPAGAVQFSQKSYPFSFNVKNVGGNGLGDLFTGEGSTLFWIIGDVVLVIVALFFIKAIFFGRKPKE